MGVIVFKVQALGNPWKTASLNNVARIGARVLIA